MKRAVSRTNHRLAELRKLKKLCGNVPDLLEMIDEELAAAASKNALDNINPSMVSEKCRALLETLKAKGGNR